MSTNPYAAPKAQVADETVILPGNFLPEGRGVPSGHGWDWIVGGWNLFKRAPGTWIGIIVILAVIFIALAVVPYVGSLASMVLGPVFGAGLMIGCRALDENRDLQIGQLFAGFRERFGTLAAVGALYLAASVAIALVVGLAMGVSIATLLGAEQASAGGAAATVALAFLVMFALLLPIVMAIWFAPPLVVFHKMGAFEAMKASFVGCLKNIVPFVVYGLIGLVLAIVASLLLMLGWLVLGPVLAASIYAAYRDIYFSA